MSNSVINSKLLETIPNISHGFMTRDYGEDYDKVADHFNLAKSSHLIPLKQVHGKTIIPIKDIEQCESHQGNNRYEADGLLTATAKIGLVIRTADCTPILFASKCGTLVGGVHAGWRGAVGEIIETMIEAFDQNSFKPNQIVAAIGPTIAQKSYEVSPEFIDNLLNLNPAHDMFLIASNNEGHALFDLPGFCALKLKNLGVEDIDLMDIDTYSNEDILFSHRRATHRGTADQEGRQVSVIMIDKS